MKRWVLAVSAGVTMLVASSVALFLIAWSIIAARGGSAAAERLAPFLNAHLLEEAAEGVYWPLRDPLFWLSAFLRMVIPFVFGAVIAVVVARNGRLWAALVTLVSGLAISLVLHPGVMSMPSPMRVAYLGESALAIVAGLLAARLALHRRAVASAA